MGVRTSKGWRHLKRAAEIAAELFRGWGNEARAKTYDNKATACDQLARASDADEFLKKHPKKRRIK